MTDWYMDEMAQDETRAAMILKFPVSRLVVDPERFRQDEQEKMALAGMGAVYQMTHDGKPLRASGPSARERLLERYYDPHHARLAQSVSDILAASGKCLILDLHSFPSHALPYEILADPDAAAIRPDICIGTCDFHTPGRIVEAIKDYCAGRRWTCETNRPFGGTMVPLLFYKKDRRVASVMLEVNRALYMDEKTGRKLPCFLDFKRMFVDLLTLIEEAYGQTHPGRVLDRSGQG